MYYRSPGRKPSFARRYSTTSEQSDVELRQRKMSSPPSQTLRRQETIYLPPTDINGCMRDFSDTNFAHHDGYSSASGCEDSASITSSTHHLPINRKPTLLELAQHSTHPPASVASTDCNKTPTNLVPAFLKTPSPPPLGHEVHCSIPSNTPFPILRRTGYQCQEVV